MFKLFSSINTRTWTETFIGDCIIELQTNHRRSFLRFVWSSTRTELDTAALSWSRPRLMLWPGYDHVTMYEGRSSARQPGLSSFYKAITAAAPAEPICPLHLPAELLLHILLRKTDGQTSSIDNPSPAAIFAGSDTPRLHPARAV